MCDTFDSFEFISMSKKHIGIIVYKLCVRLLFQLDEINLLKKKVLLNINNKKKMCYDNLFDKTVRKDNS